MRVPREIDVDRLRGAAAAGSTRVARLRALRISIFRCRRRVTQLLCCFQRPDAGLKGLHLLELFQAQVAEVFRDVRWANFVDAVNDRMNQLSDDK